MVSKSPARNLHATPFIPLSLNAELKLEANRGEYGGGRLAGAQGGRSKSLGHRALAFRAPRVPGTPVPEISPLKPLSFHDFIICVGHGDWKACKIIMTLCELLSLSLQNAEQKYEGPGLPATQTEVLSSCIYWLGQVSLNAMQHGSRRSTNAQDPD